MKCALCTLPAVLIVLFLCGCSGSEQPASKADTETVRPTTAAPASAGQASVADNESQANIVKIASGSSDHTTLVTALKAAGLVDALANAGPFTVFAPSNAAFDKLPAGTVDDLLKPENADRLKNILQYHVTPGVYKAAALKNGQQLGMVNGQNAHISVEGEVVKINDATVVASVPASNGIIHVIDRVLMPPQ